MAAINFKRFIVDKKGINSMAIASETIVSGSEFGMPPVASAYTC